MSKYRKLADVNIYTCDILIKRYNQH